MDRSRPGAGPVPRPGSPGHRGRRLLAAAALAGSTIFLLGSLIAFIWPATDRPSRVEAVLSLDGPDEGARSRLAVSLVRRGYAPVLLFSQGNYRSTPCPLVAGVRVVCFEPAPAHTIGEVRWATRYARAHSIRSILVVSGRAQVIRAQLLMARCFTGRTIVVPASGGWSRVPSQVVHEWGALFKALVIVRGC